MDYPGKAFLPPVLQSIQIRFRKWITLQLHHCLVYVFHDNEVGIDKCCVVLLCVPAADFVLLLCASQQWKVFECEHMEEWMVLAGENTDDPDPMEGRLFNPAPNYVNCR